jgi:hypothetical protein
MEIIHVKTNFLNVNAVLPKRWERQRRLKDISLSISMLDILIEKLKEGDEHNFMGLNENWLFNNDVNDPTTVDVIVMLQNNEVLPLKVEF